MQIEDSKPEKIPNGELIIQRNDENSNSISGSEVTIDYAKLLNIEDQLKNDELKLSEPELTFISKLHNY